MILRESMKFSVKQLLDLSDEKNYRWIVEVM